VTTLHHADGRQISVLEDNAALRRTLQEYTLPPLEFARERLGWWDEPDGTAAAFGPGHWEACGGTERPEGLPLGALAIAVTFDLTHAAIGGAAVDDDGVAYIKPLRHNSGTSWVVDAAKELQTEHGVEVVIDGRGPGADLVDDLKDAKVRLRVIDTQELCDACSELFKGIQDRKVKHGSYVVLDNAVSAATWRTVGDRRAWGRKTSDGDISTLEAVTLAAWYARQRPAPKPAAPQVESGPSDTTGGGVVYSFTGDLGNAEF
jgi:hypothetical protein